jgi:hypothetical protein
MLVYLASAAAIFTPIAVLAMAEIRHSTERESRHVRSR